MQQASILMTALVMIMGGAWFALYELSGGDAASAAEAPVSAASN
jgi:hypothetical protein